MMKVAGLTVLALLSGTAAGVGDQGDFGLAWTLPLLAGSGFLLAVPAPRLAGLHVLLSMAGVLLATLLTPSLHAALPGRDPLADAVAASAVAGLVVSVGSLPGAALGLLLRHRRGRRRPPAPRHLPLVLRQRVSIDGPGGAT
ncbi:MAG: hypothetical protein RLY86_1986 [Pseudomonadota bacterium]|jgi:uncharacterized SAM-binding protein YcdF (DUF218 family)